MSIVSIFFATLYPYHGFPSCRKNNAVIFCVSLRMTWRIFAVNFFMIISHFQVTYFVSGTEKLYE